MARNLSLKTKVGVLKSYLGSWFQTLTEGELKVLSKLPSGRDLALYIKNLNDARRYVSYLLLRHPGRKDYRVLHLFEISEIQFGRSKLYDSITDIHVPWLFIVVDLHRLENRLSDEILLQLLIVRQQRGRDRNVLFLLESNPELVEELKDLGYWIGDPDGQLKGVPVKAVAVKKKKTKKNSGDDARATDDSKGIF